MPENITTSEARPGSSLAPLPSRWTTGAVTRASGRVSRISASRHWVFTNAAERLPSRPRTSEGLTSSPKSVTRRDGPAPGASVHQRRPGCASHSGCPQASAFKPPAANSTCVRPAASMASEGSASSAPALTVLDVHEEPVKACMRTPEPSRRNAIRGRPAASSTIRGPRSCGAPVDRCVTTHGPPALVA